MALAVRVQVPLSAPNIKPPLRWLFLCPGQRQRLKLFLYYKRVSFIKVTGIQRTGAAPSRLNRLRGIDGNYKAVGVINTAAIRCIFKSWCVWDFLAQYSVNYSGIFAGCHTCVFCVDQ